MSTERKTNTEYDTKQIKLRRKILFIRGAAFAVSIAASLLLPAILAIAGPWRNPTGFLIPGLAAIFTWFFVALNASRPITGVQTLFTALSVITILGITALLFVYAGPAVIANFITNLQRIVDPTASAVAAVALLIGHAAAGVITSVVGIVYSDAAVESTEDSQTQTPASAPELHQTASPENGENRIPLLPQAPNREHDREHDQERGNLYPNLLSGSRSTLLKAPSKAPAATSEIEIVSVTHDAHYDYNMS